MNPATGKMKVSQKAISDSQSKKGRDAAFAITVALFSGVSAKLLSPIRISLADGESKPPKVINFVPAGGLAISMLSHWSSVPALLCAYHCSPPGGSLIYSASILLCRGGNLPGRSTSIILYSTLGRFAFVPTVEPLVTSIRNTV